MTARREYRPYIAYGYGHSGDHETVESAQKAVDFFGNGSIYVRTDASVIDALKYAQELIESHPRHDHSSGPCRVCEVDAVLREMLGMDKGHPDEVCR